MEPAWALPQAADGAWEWLQDGGGGADSPLEEWLLLEHEELPRSPRCLDATHAAAGGAGCACVPPPAAGDERSYELVRDAAGRPGERRARALLALTPEWACAEARARLAAQLSAEPAAAHLVASLRGRDVGQLRKRDVFALARAWGLRSDVWRRRGGGGGAARRRTAAGGAAAPALSRAAARRLTCPLEAYVTGVLTPASLRGADAYRCAAAAALAAADPWVLPPAVTEQWVAAVRAARRQPPGKVAWHDAAARVAADAARAAPEEPAWRVLRREHLLEARLRAACAAAGATSHVLRGLLQHDPGAGGGAVLGAGSAHLLAAWCGSLDAGDDACDEGAALASALLAERRSNGSARDFYAAVGALERFIGAQAARFDDALEDHCAWLLRACAAQRGTIPPLQLPPPLLLPSGGALDVVL